MSTTIVGLRPFLPAKDYQASRRFYAELGFEEVWTSDDLTVFSRDGFAFYLQNAYVREWAENLMLQLSVESADDWWEQLKALSLDARYEGVRMNEPRNYPWGSREVHLIDPAGVCWHIAEERK
jgi:catechol 2,3-dioxygenase-like lactoylglutathione lyase family enzyme